MASAFGATPTRTSATSIGTGSLSGFPQKRPSGANRAHEPPPLGHGYRTLRPCADNSRLRVTAGFSCQAERAAAVGRTGRSNRCRANDRNRRVSPVDAYYDEGRLTEPTADAQPRLYEPLKMPQAGHSSGGQGLPGVVQPHSIFRGASNYVSRGRAATGTYSRRREVGIGLTGSSSEKRIAHRVPSAKPSSTSSRNSPDRRSSRPDTESTSKPHRL